MLAATTRAFISISGALLTLKALAKCKSDAAERRLCKRLSADRPLARYVVKRLKAAVAESADREIAGYLVRRLETSLAKA